MNRLRHQQNHAILEEFGREGRTVQLYEHMGHSVFPVVGASGGLMSSVALYPILRGKDPRPPAFTGEFPSEHGQIVELGDGWRVMCVILRGDFTPEELRSALTAAEEGLLKRKE